MVVQKDMDTPARAFAARHGAPVVELVDREVAVSTPTIDAVLALVRLRGFKAGA